MSAGAEGRVLDEAGGARAMTGVMAAMLFLLLLAAAAGLGLASARASLVAQLAGRVTVSVVDGDAARRSATTARLVKVLRGAPDVRRVVPVDPGAVADLVRPWLGAEAFDPDLPIPRLVDADLVDADPARVARVTALALRVAPGARVDPHLGWMAPVAGLLGTLVGVAGAVSALVALATGLVVILAARAGLERHRPTIEVMHMLGSTDRQVARLFQRRIAMDAATGGGLGAAAALLVLWLVGRELAGLGSDLLGAVRLSGPAWIALACVPILFVALATGAARAAITADLRRTL